MHSFSVDAALVEIQIKILKAQGGLESYSWY